MAFLKLMQLLLFGILKWQFGHKLKIALPKIHPFKITTTVIDFYTF